MANERNPEAGVTLVVSMLIVLALMGMGMTGIWLASLHMSASRNLNSRAQAANAAQAGLQHARQILRQIAINNPSNPHPWSIPLPGQSNARDDIPSVGNPGGKGAIMYDGTRALSDYAYPDTLPTKLGKYTVWIRNDRAEINKAAQTGGSMTTDGNGAVIVRVVGQDPAGQSTVVIESALTQQCGSGSGNLDNFVFGKNVDPYGSNSVSGSVRF